MWAHVERHGRCHKQCGGLIRIFEDSQQFGDPYVYVFPFRMIDDNTIELQGIVGRAPTPAEGRAMLKACRERGWTVCRERKSGCRQGLRNITRRFHG